MSKVRRLLYSLLSGVFIVLFSGSAVLAQIPDGQTPGSGLNITPTRNELRIEPGKLDKIQITLTNVSGGDITAKVFVNDFESDNDTGEPRLITDPARSLETIIKRFLVGVGDIPLAKDEQKNFDIPVEIPLGTAPGAYYGVIRYAAVPKNAGTPDEGQQQVSLTASVGSLVLIEVPGDITEQLQLRSIKIYNDKKAGNLFTRKPSQIGIEVKNAGNTFSKPFGTVNVTDIFGKKIHSYEINNTNPRANVLPNSTRIFRDDLKGLGVVGRYTVTASVSYANGSEVLTSKASFWIIPIWVVVVLFVLLSAIIFGTKLLYDKRFKRSKK